MGIPLINGRAYDYTQLLPIFLGAALPSMSSITYEETQDKENNFGIGNRPASRGHGAINATGTMELSQNDIEALRDAAPNGSLLQIPASDFQLTFGHPTNVQTHILKNLEFTTDGGGGTQGDTDLKMTLNFTISHVEYR